MLKRRKDGSTLTVHSTSSDFQDSFILKRIPWEMHAHWSAALLDSFLAGTEVALAFLSGDRRDHYEERDAIMFLCRLVAQCFDALAFSSREAASYSCFHRDAIIRFVVLRAGKGLDKAREVVSLLEANANAKPSYPDASDIAFSDTSDVSKPLLCWLEAVVNACAAAADQSLAGPLSDPFAKSPLHVMLFQQVHVMAHQLGLSLLTEAQALTLVRPALESNQEVQAFTLTLPPLEADPPPPVPRQSSPPAASCPPWMLLVEAGSEKGKVLMRRFRDELGAAYQSCSEALQILRRRELGEQRLESAIEHLSMACPATSGADPLKALLARFFWGSLAYYQYSRGEFTQSEGTLNKAGERLNEAISAEFCLAPCAPLNSDLPLQRARVARRLGNWSKVASELSLLADLESGRRPLCYRDDGLAINYPLLESMFSQKFTSGDPGAYLVREYLDHHARIRRLNQWIRGFYLQEGAIVAG
jgi:hypothetical protein